MPVVFLTMIFDKFLMLSTGDMTGTQMPGQGLGIDHEPPRQIQEQRAGPHAGELRFAEETRIFGTPIDMQADGLGRGQ